MRCPSCNRPTQPRPRAYRGDVLRPGVLTASLLDGTCFSCYQGHGKVRNRIPRMKATEQELDTARRSVAGYWAARRRRGVPAEGAHVATLVKPGLFLQEVP